MHSGLGGPRFIVCEDGDEYVRRFTRFLSPRFAFSRANDYVTLCDLLESHPAVTGLLFDLDFRRTPVERLVDELGGKALPATDEEQRHIAANQGIAMICALRHRGNQTPIILFADLESDKQLEFLTRTLSPLQVAPSSLGLNELLVLLDRLAGSVS